MADGASNAGIAPPIFVTEGTVEKQYHLKGLHYMGRLAYGANPAKITRVS
jgi:hypothetical protein